MSDKLPAPCEHCKATGLFGGSECRECDGKGYRLIVDGRVIPRKFEKGMTHRRKQTRQRQPRQVERILRAG
jgi:DnaJ-class molecular chaperone